MTKVSTAVAQHWAARRKAIFAPTPPRRWADLSPVEQLVAGSAPIPPGPAEDLAAACLATQLVRGTPAAIALSDLFAAQRVRLPLLNWPTAALRPLEVSS